MRRVGERPGVAAVVDVQGDVPVHAEQRRRAASRRRSARAAPPRGRSRCRGRRSRRAGEAGRCGRCGGPSRAQSRAAVAISAPPVARMTWPSLCAARRGRYRRRSSRAPRFGAVGWPIVAPQPCHTRCYTVLCHGYRDLGRNTPGRACAALISRADVREGPGREPGRDRDPGHAGARGDGHRLGRRLLRGRPRDAPRARGRRGLPARPAGARRELPHDREDHRGRQASRAPRRSIPATASWPRTPPSPTRARGGGASSSSARRRARSRRWARRPGPARSCRRPASRSSPARPSPRPTSRRRARPPRRSATRSPARPRAAAAARAFASRQTRRRARGGVRGRRPRGREVLLRRPRLPRALPRGPAPRRGPGARRLARQRDPPRRARLLDPAPPPEADRGGAGPARRRGDARADRQDRHRRRAAPSTTAAPARSRGCRSATSTSSSR